MLPLLLGLGLLAGNQLIGEYRKQQKDQAVADQYKGLLGVAPGAMGPPDESGNMGYTAGQGLLADPSNITNQLQFAAGVAGLPGQQAPGLNLLNAAFGRAQQQAEQAQQASQFQQGQQNWQKQFDQGQQNWQAQYDANRADAARAAQQWAQSFGLQTQNAARAADQWRQQFGLSQSEFGLKQQEFGLRAAQALAPQNTLPSLGQGYGYVMGPDGKPIAAPMPGTPDYAKAKATEGSLLGTVGQINDVLDLLEGKEVTTPQGNKIRTGGYGSEATGQIASKYSVLRGQIMSGLGKLADMGVLQEGEQKRLADQLPDPTSIGSYMTRNSTMATAYEEVLKQFQNKLEQHYAANPWLTPPPPAGYVPMSAVGAAAPAASAGAAGGILAGLPQAVPKRGRVTLQ